MIAARSSHNRRSSRSSSGERMSLGARPIGLSARCVAIRGPQGACGERGAAGDEARVEDAFDHPRFKAAPGR